MIITPYKGVHIIY